MHINIDIQEDATDTVVTIKCPKQDAFVERLIAALKIIDKQIMVMHEGNMTSIDLEDILYIESVDRKCFIYTVNKVYESFNKLYELEQQLEQYLFVRINKSCVVNLKNIDSIKTYLDRRLLITMSNNEQLIVSRQYAGDIKTLLGVNKHSQGKERDY
ncbi:MAG: LytTR family transcriptional regulator DNA-binding domain-containing protein [Lachnospiraceae bacterium]|nr:LytTR family transcriptional regulator DNA-binding domain-containing protein [Lachnospiraceae bacterium]